MVEDIRQVSSSSSSEDNINGTRSVDKRMASSSSSGGCASDNDKRDILDLLKLSYIVVRTGIGTGQIMVIFYTKYEQKFYGYYVRMCLNLQTAFGQH